MSGEILLSHCYCCSNFLSPILSFFISVSIVERFILCVCVCPRICVPPALLQCNPRTDVSCPWIEHVCACIMDAQMCARVTHRSIVDIVCSMVARPAYARPAKTTAIKTTAPTSAMQCIIAHHWNVVLMFCCFFFFISLMFTCDAYF